MNNPVSDTGNTAVQAEDDTLQHAPRVADKAVPILLSALALGVVYFLLSEAVTNLSHRETLAAIIWPAPALGIAVLWRAPYRQWVPYLVMILAAMMLPDTPGWDSTLVDFQFALLNVVEVALGAFLGRRFVSPQGGFNSIRQLARFVLLIALFVAAVAAALGATIAVIAQPQLQAQHWLHEWSVIMVGNGLAILIIVPAWFAWRRPVSTSAVEVTPASLWFTLTPSLLTLLLVLASVPIALSAELLRVALSLVLAWAALYGGLRAVSLALIVATISGVVLTSFDLGAYGRVGDSGIWRLQLDLAGVALLSFFIAIAVRERREIHARLERARRFESLGLLTGGIAHDFNNILAAVGGYAEIASEQMTIDSPAQPALREVDAAVLRGKEMTEQILLIGRRGDRQREQLDLRDVVTEAASLAQRLCPAGVRIELQLPSMTRPVLGHRGQLVRAALNLLRNASQAARCRVLVVLDSGSMAATAMDVGDAPTDAVWIDVADDGTGIPSADLPRLFEPFFTVRSKGGGTGLGLAIVAGIAIEHAGGVQIRRDRAGYTHFRLALPFVRTVTQPIGIAALPLHDSPPLGNGQRVLVLDADVLRRECAEEWLAELGFEPVGYTDLASVLAALTDAFDDICLLLVQPSAEMDVTLLSSQVRQLVSGLPVVVGGVNDVKQGMPTPGVIEMGAVFDRSTLVIAVRRALEEHSDII
ncbi:MAG: ATP-binding protein [Herbaspirillum sp.]